MDGTWLVVLGAGEKSGQLKPGGTVIEGTSSNTGMGLALAANLKGYRTVFTMNDKQSREKQLVLKAFGARPQLAAAGLLIALAFAGLLLLDWWADTFWGLGS